MSGDPRRIEATPPTTTNSTSWRLRARRISAILRGASTSTVLASEVYEVLSFSEPLRGRQGELVANLADVSPVQAPLGELELVKICWQGMKVHSHDSLIIPTVTAEALALSDPDAGWTGLEPRWRRDRRFISRWADLLEIPG